LLCIFLIGSDTYGSYSQKLTDFPQINCFQDMIFHQSYPSLVLTARLLMLSFIQSGVFRLPSSVIPARLTSVRRGSSVFFHPSSVIRLRSSVIRHPSSLPSCLRIQSGRRLPSSKTPDAKNSEKNLQQEISYNQ